MCAVHADLPSDKKYKLRILQAILLKLWQIIGNMYIERSCNFPNLWSRHFRVIEKFYNLLGRPSYIDYNKNIKRDRGNLKGEKKSYLGLGSIFAKGPKLADKHLIK